MIAYLKVLIFILISSILNLFGLWSLIFPSIDFILVLKIKLINKANNSSFVFSFILKWFKISSIHATNFLLFNHDLSLSVCFSSLTMPLIFLSALVILSANLNTTFLNPLSNLLFITSILVRSTPALGLLILPLGFFINQYY